MVNLPAPLYQKLVELAAVLDSEPENKDKFCAVMQDLLYQTCVLQHASPEALLIPPRSQASEPDPT